MNNTGPSPSNTNKNRFFSIVLWSLISAAFIGPGTLTTATMAGAQYGPQLLWALVFATLACIVLQEAAARVSLLTGLSLGAAIAKQFANNALKGAIAAAIIIGCAAYQAGNILGAILGLKLVLNTEAKGLTLGVGGCAALLLWSGGYRGIAKVMSIAVALMGIVFVYTAAHVEFDALELVHGAVVPRLPSGGEWIALGLIGTTIVPYNLFLGSGLSKGQSLGDMRFGLYIALGFGGLVSIAILLTGTLLGGEANFELLAEQLQAQIGAVARPLLAIGLFAAGFSSSTTAPLAAALTARSLFPKADGTLWHHRSKPYVLVWGGVLLSGLVFGVLEVKPIPMIILAQAINGLLLPLVSIVVLWIVNDRRFLQKGPVNGPLSNAFLLLIVAVTIFLGLNNVAKATVNALDLTLPGTATMMSGLAIGTLLILGAVVRKTLRLRKPI